MDPADLLNDPVIAKPSLMDELMALGSSAQRTSQIISDRAEEQEQSLRRVKKKSRELEQEAFGCLISDLSNLKSGAPPRAH